MKSSCAMHSFGVANYMKNYAKDFGLNLEKMFIIGWLHDVENLL